MVCLNFKTYHKLILTDIQNYKLSHFSWCMAYFARGLDNIKKKNRKEKRTNHIKGQNKTSHLPDCCCTPRSNIINNFASIPSFSKLSLLFFHGEGLAKGYNKFSQNKKDVGIILHKDISFKLVEVKFRMQRLYLPSWSCFGLKSCEKQMRVIRHKIILFI